MQTGRSEGRRYDFGVESLCRLEFFAFDFHLVGRLVLLVRMLIPTLVRRPLTSAHALRVAPLMPATWAQAARPERIPDSPAFRVAKPPVRGRGAPRTVRTIDLGFAVHR